MSSEVEIPRPMKLSSLQQSVAGVWKLISAENFVNGQWVDYVFGNPPSGYFFYDASGYASVQIMTTPPVTVVEPADQSPSAAEALDIWNGYIAYYGTWTVDAEYITVQVEGSWDPRQVGGPQQRPYQLDGDTLIIGDQVTYKRTLQRVG